MSGGEWGGVHDRGTPTVSVEDVRLFQAILSAHNLQADRRGECHIRCPKCGREPKANQVHFSFSVKGGKCFVCNWGTSLRGVAAELGQMSPDELAQMTTNGPDVLALKPKKMASWTRNPEAYLNEYLRAPDRVDQWQRYKPLRLESISRWELGVGVLPASRCKHRRLIIPARVDGKIVAFRGRILKENGCDCDTRRAKGLRPVCEEGCNCDKWLTCGSSQTVLFNAERLCAGATVIICENMLDTILAMERFPVVAVCGTAGAGTWKSEWTDQILDSQPKQIIVWFDNDLAGLPNEETYAKLISEWKVKQEELLKARKIAKIGNPPEPNGQRLVNALNKAQADRPGKKVPVKPVKWPSGTPIKHDIADALETNYTL